MPFLNAVSLIELGAERHFNIVCVLWISFIITTFTHTNGALWQNHHTQPLYLRPTLLFFFFLCEKWDITKNNRGVQMSLPQPVVWIFRLQKTNLYWPLARSRCLFQAVLIFNSLRMSHSFICTGKLFQAQMAVQAYSTSYQKENWKNITSDWFDSFIPDMLTVIRISMWVLLYQLYNRAH